MVRQLEQALGEEEPLGGWHSQVLHLTVLGGTRFTYQRGRGMVCNSKFSKVTNCFQREFMGLGQVLAGINSKFLQHH